MEVNLDAMTLADAARAYNVDYFALDNAARRKLKIKPARIVGGVRLFSQEQITAMVEAIGHSRHNAIVRGGGEVQL